MSLIDQTGGEIKSDTVSEEMASSALNKLEVIDPDSMVATQFNILLRVVSVEEITENGIILPGSFFTKQLFDKTRAVLVKAGDEAFTNSNGDYWSKVPEIGGTVITSKYAGNLYRDEAFNLYRHAIDNDVCFIVGRENE